MNEAVALDRRALELDPLSPATRASYVQVLANAGRTAEAEKELQKGREDLAGVEAAGQCSLRLRPAPRRPVKCPSHASGRYGARNAILVLDRDTGPRYRSVPSRGSIPRRRISTKRSTPTAPVPPGAVWRSDSHGARHVRPDRPGLNEILALPAVMKTMPNAPESSFVPIPAASATTPASCHSRPASAWSATGPKPANGRTSVSTRTCPTTASAKRRNTSSRALRAAFQCPEWVESGHYVPRGRNG